MGQARLIESAPCIIPCLSLCSLWCPWPTTVFPDLA